MLAEPGLRQLAAVKSQSLIKVSAEQTSGNALLNNMAALRFSMALVITTRTIGCWLVSRSFPRWNTRLVWAGQVTWGETDSGVASLVRCSVAVSSVSELLWMPQKKKCCSPECQAVLVAVSGSGGVDEWRVARFCLARVDSSALLLDAPEPWLAEISVSDPPENDHDGCYESSD